MDAERLGGWIEGWIDRGSCRLRVPDGYRILCLEGTLWLTRETPETPGPVADVVLQAGQCWSGAGAASLIASALGRAPVRLALVAQPGQEWRLKAGSTTSANSSSIDACARPAPVTFNAT